MICITRFVLSFIETYRPTRYRTLCPALSGMGKSLCKLVTAEWCKTRDRVALTRVFSVPEVCMRTGLEGEYRSKISLFLLGPAQISSRAQWGIFDQHCHINIQNPKAHNTIARYETRNCWLHWRSRVVSRRHSIIESSIWSADIAGTPGVS
ncbi:hypothetical protein FIBSPDRAFT_64878 [Athelia psychrophila]|uniref:Uncharacterized protein n=1 Tax=Athelia psychrophila TaxID=1759441 RepID=A0A166EVX5_9AGAM|nr:hypothetical protein FIBSPDRAFT_64878 [Fibularhizoctonia sp. CBS 109695]